MIRINLLGKRKSKGPLGLNIDELLGKLGYQGRASDFAEFKPQFIKLVIVLVFYYLSSIAPEYWLEENMTQTDAELATVTEAQEKLKRELDSKKEVRAQMTKLQKDEADTKRQLDIINSISVNRGQVFKVVERIGALMPSLVWVDNLDFNETSIKLSGGSWDYAPINDFVKGLTETPHFEAVRLQGINSIDAPDLIPDFPKEKQKVKSYMIEFSWNPGVASG